MTKSANIILLLLCVFLSSCDDKKVLVTNTIKGLWKCEEYNVLTGNRAYMVDIERSKSDTTLYLLSNFHNGTNENNEVFVTAHLKKNTLTIDPSQQIIGTSIVVKSGAGIVSDNLARINLNYIIYNGASEIAVQAFYTRP